MAQKIWTGAERISHHVCYRCGVAWDAYGVDCASGVVRYCPECARVVGRFSSGKNGKVKQNFGGKIVPEVPLIEYLD